MVKLLNSIKDLYDINGHISSTKLRYLPKKDPKLFQLILSKTNFLATESTLLERIYVIENNITKLPICECGEILRFINKSRRYSLTCKNSCRFFTNKRIVKARKKVKEKYGVENVFSLDKFQTKAKKTLKTNYGVDHALQVPEFKSKAKNTSLLKFGSTPMNNASVQEKHRATTFRNYGVNNPSQSDTVKIRKETTTKKNFGVSNPFQSNSIKDKIKESNLSKYGTNHPSRLHLDNKIKRFLENEDKLKRWLTILNHKKGLNLLMIGSLIGVSDTTIGKYFKSLNIEVKYNTHKSSLEESVYKYFKQLNLKPERNFRGFGKEFDFYFPDLKIAVETHGVFWHSAGSVERDLELKNIHRDKYKLAVDNGIKLFQIFENEWADENKQLIWKSMLSYYLKPQSVNKLYARKCEVREITSQEGRDFLSVNHLQNDYKATKKYFGLLYKNQLVSVMSFCKPRFNKKIEWEIARYANLLNFQVVGGASKLFKHFLKEEVVKSVITYADLRYSSGNVYEQMGFSFLKDTKPNYFYYNTKDRKSGIKLLNRVNFQKHKLSEKLDKFHPNLTETQNMFINGYRRIWDAGNKSFVFFPKVLLDTCRYIG